jgi:hypothetical protein
MIPFPNEVSQRQEITMEIGQNIWFKLIRMREDFCFVQGHRAHTGIEKEVYDSPQSVVFFILSITLLKLSPTNAAGLLPSDAYMNQNPEKGLDVMHGIMKNSTFMSRKVSSTRQDFTTGVWRGALEMH